MGYKRQESILDISKKPDPCEWRKHRDMHDEYGVYMSITGRQLKTFVWDKGRDYEEERMINIAENIASTLRVDVNAIALTKGFCKETGECKVFVTVCSSETPRLD